MSDEPTTYRIELAGTARRDLRGLLPRIVPAIARFAYGELVI